MKSITIKHISSPNEIQFCNSAKIDCVNWKDYAYSPEVIFKIAYTDTCLVIRYDVKEIHAKAICLKNNGKVWNDSCVEFFVKDPDSDFYFNFETNCIGSCLAAKRRSKEDFILFPNKKIKQINIIPSFSKTITDIKRECQWSVRLEIPFNLIDMSSIPTRLLANFYKCGDGTSIPHYLSWSPICLPTPNFHCPEFFGEINFETEI